MANGLIIAAPRSGSGKTVVTLGLAAALKARGLKIAPGKTGPDYIDPAFLARAANSPALNFDPWAMSPPRLRDLASRHAAAADLLLIEGVMGLFDGAADGTGSTADLATLLDLPVVLVIDAQSQSQSVGALVWGFANWRIGLRIAGVIFNRVGSPRHEAMLRTALSGTGIACLGAIPRAAELAIPERHLGLVLPDEIAAFTDFIDHAAALVAAHVDLDALLACAAPVPTAPEASRIQPLGQRIAIAHDAAFAFTYPHLLSDWRAAGAELTLFSPLADQSPGPTADAVFLPGGYPELHGGTLAAAATFKAGLTAAASRNALIYGECGGFMVLGESLIDKTGASHAMAGLLPLTSRIDQPRRTLGYRRLSHHSTLPFGQDLFGHEFHYSSAAPTNLPPLFTATDALGVSLAPMGAVLGRVMGSYAHVIDQA